MIFRTVAVVGSGTMGTGIAAVAATAGRRVVLYDVSGGFLDAAMLRIEEMLGASAGKGRMTRRGMDAALRRIAPTVDLTAIAQAQCVVEAAPERLDLKRGLFERMSAAVRPACVLATNTSSLSVTAIAAAATRPERVAGLHFFNPAPAMKLVEVVAARHTAPETLDALERFAVELGKTPVRVRDTPGFVVNRVARPFYNEALRLLEEGVADAPTVDALVRAHGFRMGPFELIDLIGNDVNYAVTLSLYEAFHGDPRYRPSRLQRAMVEAGALGRKSGEGFYAYGGEDA